MAENISIEKSLGKESKYESLLPQIMNLIAEEKNLIANLANIAAALKNAMDFFWVGFYLVDHESEKKELVLGPFQGPVACTRIAFGKGVCGKSWEQKKVIIVEDVDEFPGHIACSSQSRSEIVLPVFNKAKIVAVLDIDSDKLASFDRVDEQYLNKLIKEIEKKFDQ